MKKLLAVMSFCLTLIITGCQCSLHTHYYNDYGVCICNHSIAYVLEYENEAYGADTQMIDDSETYYYRFIAHGEEVLEFHVNSEDVSIDRIEIRTDGRIQDVASRVDSEKKVYVYDNYPFSEGKEYYLKVKYVGDGSIKMLIKQPQ